MRSQNTTNTTDMYYASPSPRKHQVNSGVEDLPPNSEESFCPYEGYRLNEDLEHHHLVIRLATGVALALSLADPAKNGSEILPVNDLVQFCEKIALLIESGQNVFDVEVNLKTLNNYCLSSIDLYSINCILRLWMRQFFEVAK
ncbi:MAG: hypothetical protein U5N86_10515 [Planctomycetota bacterium]|nr:hypothetical protein [Planctomycetota bacterium]